MNLPTTQQEARDLLRLALSGQTENPVEIPLGTTAHQEGPPAMTQPDHTHDHPPDGFQVDVNEVLDVLHAQYGEQIADLTQKLTMKTVALSTLERQARQQIDALVQEVDRLREDNPPE